MTERLRKLRTLKELRPGVVVITEDGARWKVASRSYVGPCTQRKHKWVWLQRGNEYRQLRGSAIDTLRVVITQPQRTGQ